MRLNSRCGLLLAVAWTAVAMATGQDIPILAPEHDGQPGCQIRYEFRRLWRNNFIPEQYWECVQWRQPARARHCPPATRFQDSWQTCVSYHQWQWTPWSEPPTRPCEDAYECVEIEQRPEVPEVPEECPTDPSTTPGPGQTTTDGGNTGTTEGGGGGGGPGGPETEPAGICPGATDAQHNPGTMSCFPPECTIKQWMDETLYPTRNPTQFYQCGPGYGNLYVRTCAPGTCFSFRHQVCVHIRKWQNDCA